MGRRLIEVMQVLVDQIHQGGYQHRVLEDSIYGESQKRIAAEKDRDHWKQARQEAHEAGELMQAEIETLRTQLADAKRAASDEFTERQVLTVEQQQDAAAWQQQLDAARAENETLKGAMAADDKRLRDAEQRIWPGMTWGCDAPDKMADAILHLRQQLAEQQAETFDVRRQRNNETDRLNATNAVSVQQRDEIAYLRARLDEERSVSAGLRQQLDAANAAVTLQRAGIDRLHKFVGAVRLAMWPEDIKSALTELDAGSIQPTPVAEPAPCPECEPLQAEIERLQAFVEKVREVRAGAISNQWHASWSQIGSALAELDAGTEPTPVAEPLDAEGGA